MRTIIDTVEFVEQLLAKEAKAPGSTAARSTRRYSLRMCAFCICSKHDQCPGQCSCICQEHENTLQSVSDDLIRHVEVAVEHCTCLQCAKLRLEQFLPFAGFESYLTQ